MHGITRISREESLQAARFPLLVRHAVHSTATGRIAHDVTKVMLVNSGSTTLRHETGELVLHQGDVVLLPSGQWYAGEPAGLVVTTTAYIDTEYLQQQMRWIPDLGGTALWTPADNCSFPPLVIELPAATLPHLDATFRTLLDGQMRVEPSFHRLAHVAEFLDVLARHNGSRTPEHAVLRRAITLLLERLEEPWSISTLAEAVSMSTSQISRLFREHLGMGPAEFLRKERARRMAGLLLTSSDPVEAVAQRVGWAQASHASRAFRHTHGVSPLQYRRTHRPQTHP